MPATTDDLKAQLARLSLEERADLAYFLLNSLDQEADPGAEAAWDAELARRAGEIRSGQAAGEPAENVFARLRAPLR